jgi:proteasome lid subunit RPN8/RPN11
VVLTLTSQHIDQLSAHAEQVYPEECCGLLVGRRQAAEKSVVEVVSLDNDWASDWDGEGSVGAIADDALEPEQRTRRRRYAIAPQDLLRVQKQARDKGLIILGIYHSHPDEVAVPSECDRRLAWAEYAYVILSVRQGKTADIQNWTLDLDHQFQPEPIKMSPSSATDRMPVSA